MMRPARLALAGVWGAVIGALIGLIGLGGERCGPGQRESFG